ncbi:MAG: hypothetical protein KDH20_02585 [Rhodocyclaceae bacterium]|nr:hypothetical protein [Rhodocyclaceae bacterium]
MRSIRYLAAAGACAAACFAPAEMAGEFAAALSVNGSQATAVPYAVARAAKRRRVPADGATGPAVRCPADDASPGPVTPPERIERVFARWWMALRQGLSGAGARQMPR